MKTRQWILEILVFLTAALFIYTAGSKLADIGTFQKQLDNQVFDNAFTPFLSWAIPLSEVGIAVMLVLPRLRFYGFLAFTSLMILFTIYISLIIGDYFERVPCGCAAAFDTLSWQQHLFVNIIFLLMGAGGFFLQRMYRNCLAQRQ